MKLTLLSFTALALMMPMNVMAENPNKLDADAGVNVQAQAKSVKVETRVAPVETHPMSYDLNNDGMVSSEEIATRLFYQFDRDGNESLDNIEWNKSTEIMMMPVETVTVTEMDLDGDGVVETQDVKVDVFMKETGLVMFDTDNDGLTPHDFTGKSVLEMDTDKSGLIEMDEWRAVYVDMQSKLNANNEIYNDGE